MPSRDETAGEKRHGSPYEMRRARSRAAIRQEIIDAAHRLVLDRGMPNVSMSAVANEARISRQTLYNHFPDLEAIILEGAAQAIEVAAAKMRDVIDAAPDATGALQQFVRHSIFAMSHDDLAMGGAGGMSAGGEARALTILEEFHRPLNEILHAGVEDGSFRPDLDPDAVSELLFHMIGSSRMPIAHGRRTAEVADHMVDLIVAAVS